MKVCWQLTGIRQNRWVEANRLEVEKRRALKSGEDASVGGTGACDARAGEEK